MRKRKLYLSELLKRNKNDDIFIRVITINRTETFTSKHDLELIKYCDCEVKRWKVLFLNDSKTLDVYL